MSTQSYIYEPSPNHNNYSHISSYNNFSLTLDARLGIWETFARYEMLNKFGLCLLHKHFHVSPTELFEVQVHPERQITITQVVAQHAVSAHAPVRGYREIDVAPASVDRVSSLKGATARPFLMALRQVLREYSLESAIGIAPIDMLPPPPEKGTVLIESCDEATRRLFLKPMPETGRDVTGATQTSWVLSTERAVMWCREYCNPSPGEHQQKHDTEF